MNKLGVTSRRTVLSSDPENSERKRQRKCGLTVQLFLEEKDKYDFKHHGNLKE